MMKTQLAPRPGAEKQSIPFLRHESEACAGPKACGRCQSICPSSAIAFLDGAWHLDSSACEACGVCTVVCPTGAVQYRQPCVEDLLVVVHGRVADARLENPFAPMVVFYQAGSAMLSPKAARAEPATPHHAENRPIDEREEERIAAPVLSFPLAAVGGAGPEVWLSALAYGAGEVVVALPGAYPDDLRVALASQLAWAAGLLEELGHPRERLRLVDADTDWPAVPRRRHAPAPTAWFSPFQSKRNLIRRSALHLATCGDPTSASAPLPEEAGYGAVDVDEETCTLCLACCDVCPTHALFARGDVPALRLLEATCIQCGQCRLACPTKALTLKPRLLWAPVRAEQPTTLRAFGPWTATEPWVNRWGFEPIVKQTECRLS